MFIPQQAFPRPLPLVTTGGTTISLCSLQGDWTLECEGLGEKMTHLIPAGQVVRLTLTPVNPATPEPGSVFTMAMQSHGLVIVIDPDPGKG